MIVEQLKKSILQQAFQGKITEQNLNDSNVNETIKKINEIKDNNIKIKKYKKTPVGKPITSENITYEIPSNWSWVRFIDICSVMTCGYASTPQYVEDGMPFLSAKNVKPFNFKPQEYKKISVELYNKLTTTCKPEKNDILLTRVGAGIGESAIIDVDMDFAIYVSLSLIKLVDYNLINNKYILYWLNSPYGISTSLNNITGKDSSQGNLNVDNVRNFLIPFPPIEEQKRIVDKLDEIFKLLEEIEPIEKSLADIKSNFSIDFKYSILNYAIQGKLSKNNLNEKCSISSTIESIYEIPSNWSWVSLNDVFNIQTGLGYKKTDQCTEKDGELRVLRGGNINNNYEYELKPDDVFVKNIDVYTELKIGDILTPSVTSMEQMGKVAYIDKLLPNVTAGGFVYIIRCKDIDVLNPKFALYFLSSKFHKEMCKPNINKSGQAFYNLKKSGLVEQPMPIPPIEEQKRIVDKLDEIINLCNEINNLI